MEAKFKGLIECSECNWKFKGRNERNKLKYRCNNRLRNGKDSCSNDNCIEEEFLNDLIKQQLFVIDMENTENYESIIEKIIISKERIDINFKNLPIKNCFCDNKQGKVHFDTLTL